MGYSANLKKQRKPVIDYIDQNLKELDKDDITDDEIFEICDKILKVVELKFNIERKDQKMHNKYNKLILEDILPKRIFALSYMKPKDYSMEIEKVEKSKKKDFKFLYLYMLKHYIVLAELYNLLSQNIIDSWITEEGKDKKRVLFSKNNKTIKSAKEKNKDIEKVLRKHAEDLNKHIEENYIKELKDRDFYIKLKNLSIEVSSEDYIRNNIKQENQSNFYSFHLGGVSKDLIGIENLYDYCKDRLNLLEEYLKN